MSLAANALLRCWRHTSMTWTLRCVFKHALGCKRGGTHARAGSLKDATSLLMSAGFERPGAARGGAKSTGGTIESLDERDKY